MWKKAVCILLLSQSNLSCALAQQADANPTMHCFNPDLTVPLSFDTTSSGNGQGVSPTIQFNINTPSGGGAIFVNKDNDGFCDVSINSGYRINSGHAVFDNVNVYTANLNGSQYPNKSEILKHVIANAGQPTGNSMRFKMHESTAQFLGTVNIKFVIDYVKTSP